jgi:hypothetical protein
VERLAGALQGECPETVDTTDLLLCEQPLLAEDKAIQETLTACMARQ